MKRVIYIILFTIFGVLLQFLLHAAIEIPYLSLLNSNFEKYSLGFSWPQLLTIHLVLTILFVIAGAAFGFFAGKFFWQKIYVEHIRYWRKKR